MQTHHPPNLQPAAKSITIPLWHSRIGSSPDCELTFGTDEQVRLALGQAVSDRWNDFKQPIDACDVHGGAHMLIDAGHETAPSEELEVLREPEQRSQGDAGGKL